MTLQQHANEILEQWQSSCEGVTERRLHDMTSSIDDIRSLSNSRKGAQILRANRHQIRDAMRSLVDLWQDLEFENETAPVIHLNELRELRRDAI